VDPEGVVDELDSLAAGRALAERIEHARGRGRPGQGEHDQVRLNARRIRERVASDVARPVGRVAYQDRDREPEAALDRGLERRLELRRPGVGVEDQVPALDVGPYVAPAELGAQRPQPAHGDGLVPADVDAAQQRDEAGHAGAYLDASGRSLLMP
jgi:hypothetical protein